MKRTIQIDYSDWDLEEKIIDKLREMGVIYKNNNNFDEHKVGTLIIEFIEE